MSVPPGFEVINILGFGGMGVVYKCKDTVADATVALKLMHPLSHASQEQHDRFAQEASAVTLLEHPHIVGVHRVGFHEDRPFMSCEYIDGGGLDRKIIEEPLSPREAALMHESLARAIHYAHEKGVVHRDLKPANVLLTANNVPKITDFGLAKFTEAERNEDLTQSGMIVGTPSFMSPEQAIGEPNIGPPADIYSLGVTLYEALAQHRPFRGPGSMHILHQVVYDSPPAPSLFRSGIPPELELVLLRCLQKAPEHRYPTASDLADDLRRFLDNEPLGLAAQPLPEGGTQWLRAGGPRDGEGEKENIATQTLQIPKGNVTPSKAFQPASAAPAQAGPVEESLFGSDMESVTPHPTTAPESPPKTPHQQEQPQQLKHSRPIELFEGLSAEQVDILLRCGSHEQYDSGDVIFHEGAAANSLYIIIAGQVEIFAEDSAGQYKHIAFLFENELFGELGLILSGGIRTASARAHRPTQLIQIPGNLFELLRLFANPEITMSVLQNLMAILRARLQTKNVRKSDEQIFGEESVHYSGLPDATVEDIQQMRESFSRELTLSFRRRRKLKEGEYLLRQGDRSDGFYFIHSGVLEVLDETDRSNPRPLARLTPPNIVGEVGFFSGAERIASIRAETESVITSFTRADFDSMCKKDPKQALDVLFTSVRLVALMLIEEKVTTS